MVAVNEEIIIILFLKKMMELFLEKVRYFLQKILPQEGSFSIQSLK